MALIVIVPGAVATLLQRCSAGDLPGMFGAGAVPAARRYTAGDGRSVTLIIGVTGAVTALI